MLEGLNALVNTHTWDSVELPLENLMVGCKGVYKIKTKANGSIERYKVHLVAKGFTQEYWVDYEETFALVPHITFVHALIAIAAIKQWTLF